MSTSTTLIPVRMLVQFAYCNWLGYLEWVQGEFQISTDVEESKYQHRIVDAGSTTTGPDSTIHARSVSLSDDNLGLTAKIDLLELTGMVRRPSSTRREPYQMCPATYTTAP